MRNPALSRVVRGLSSRTSTSAIIAGLVLVAPISHAVSAGFVGTGAAQSGSFDQVGPSSIILNTSVSTQGVINWTPTPDGGGAGTSVNFLPNGNSVTFSSSGSQSYTILNRILPADATRPIALNGSIQSYLGAAGGTAGGSIWFYSPAGILVGSTAVLNIGSLLLTAGDPVLDGNGNFIDGNGHFTLGQAANGSKIVISGADANGPNGAQINAMAQPGSYVALVAPTVVQSGAVMVNGSAAYVAADAADMTINQGLFDITVTSATMGTSASGTVLTHNGSTTGPAAVMGQETHRIYLVAVPKNDAITMLISGGGTLGFDMAGAADVQGNTIVLSAGRNVSGGSIVQASNPTAPNADIYITGGSFTSAVTGVANHIANAAASTPLHFYSDLVLTAPTAAAVNALMSSAPVQIDGDLALDASVFATNFGQSVTGGSAQLSAGAGSLTIGGSLSLRANARGGQGPVGGNATGGVAVADAANGTLTVGGGIHLEADAYAGVGSSEVGPAQAGDAHGGMAALAVAGNGHFTVAQDVSGSAGAYIGFDQSNQSGGNALGGSFKILAITDGSLHVMGNVFGSLDASGGENQIMTGAPGMATGGTLLVDARDASSLTIDGTLSSSANGNGGSSYYNGVGGAGTGGMLIAGGGSGNLAIRSVSFDANGSGGTGLIGGGLGTGGSALVQALASGGNVQIKEYVDLAANGHGGGADSYGYAPAGSNATGGKGMGGRAAIDAEGGNITIGDAMASNAYLALDASGFGGSAFNGGNGTGGAAEILAKGSSVTFTPSSTSNPDRSYVVALSAGGTGGYGGSDQNGAAGRGGDGFGGTPNIIAFNTSATGPASVISLPIAYVSASGEGGSGGSNYSESGGGTGGTGGNGTGGAPLVNSEAGNGNITIGTLTLDASGLGGDGGSGDIGGVGGSGMGGFNQAGVFSGADTATTAGKAQFGTYLAFANGVGGEGGFGYTTTGGAGGFGRGGSSAITSRGGIVTVDSVTLSSDGIGGDGGGNESGNSASDGIGGGGRGGSFSVLSTPRFQTSTTGSLTVAGDINGSASGEGGFGSQTGSTAVGDFLIQAIGGSITAQNIYAYAFGDIVPMDAVASEISAVGTGVINTDQFSAGSYGDIGLFLDGGGAINAASASIFARSVTPFGEMDMAPPTGTGTFKADTFSFYVDQDFRTNASFTTPNTFGLFAPGAVQTGALVAGDEIEIHAGGPITVASASAGRVNPVSAGTYEIGLRSDTGNVNAGDITTQGNVGLLASTGSVAAGNVTTDRSLVVLSANDVTLGSVTTATTGSGAGVYLANASMYQIVQEELDPSLLFAVAPVAVGGSIHINGPVSTSQFVAAANGAFASSSIDATDRININFDKSTGAMHGTSLTTGNLTSGRNVLLQTDGNAAIGSVTASDSIITISGGTTNIGDLSAGRVNPTVTTSDGYVANVFAAGGSTIGSVTAKGEVRFDSLNGSISAGNIVTDRDLIVLAKQNVTLGSITTALLPTVGGPSNNQTTNPGAVYIGHSDGTIMPAWQTLPIDPVRVDGSITINGAVTTGQFQAAASGAFTASSIASNDFILIDAGGAIAINALASRYKTKIMGDGAATIGSMDTGDEGHVEVAGQVTVTSATAGRMTFSGTAPSGGNQNNNSSGDGPSVVLVGGTGVSLGTASALGDIGLVSNGNVVVTGNLVSDASVGALVGGNVTLGAVTTGGGASGVYIGNSSLYPLVKDTNGNAAEILFAYSPPPPIGGSILINGPVSGGRFEAAALGNITTGALSFVNDVQAVAGGSITTGAITSQQRIDLTSGGSSTLGALVAGSRIEVEAGGSAAIASASAGRVNPSTDSTADYLVGIRSGTGVSIGDVTAKGNVGLLATTGNVSAGNITADQSLVVLSANNVTLGNVTTSGDGIYLANASMYPIVADVLTPSLLFAQAPARVGGSILINGQVSTAQFAAASAGAFTANTLAASSRINIDSGALTTFNGAVTAPTIAIGSLDLAIGSTGSLGGTGTSSLTLTSGGTDTTIGGSATTGLTGAATTYQLDNAEFGRLRAGQINVAAQGNVTMGTLNISGSGSSTGNLVGSNARFQVQTPGSIRVVGSVNLANAASTDTLGIIAGNRFEIVTDTGQLQLLGTDGKVGGIAAITAANIAVGTSSIVTQLAADPKFAGRDSLLASAPFTGSKLDGYLQAGRMKFTVGNTLFIQNSGVGDTLAGFTVGSGGIQIANSGTNPIDVVIYGRAFDGSGTEIPTASIGSAVTASQTSAISNVDGCVFATGVCSPVNTGASAQMVAQTQLAGISSSIQSSLGGNVGAGAPPPIDNGTSSVGSSVSDGGGAGGGSGGDDDEGGGETEAKGNGGGGAKPNVLIDTNAIASNAGPQIDTPVTSSGNTSLWIGEDGLTGDIGSSGTGNGQ
jgi:filamentous hemagglutinin family protein